MAGKDKYMYFQLINHIRIESKYNIHNPKITFIYGSPKVKIHLKYIWQGFAHIKTCDMHILTNYVGTYIYFCKELTRDWTLGYHYRQFENVREINTNVRDIKTHVRNRILVTGKWPLF